MTVEQINAAFSDKTNGLRQLIQKVATKKCDCAKNMCNGNGRCHGVGVGGYAECQCFEGYSGVNCTKKIGEARDDTAQKLKTVASHSSDAASVEEARVVCPDAISSCGAGQTCGQFVGGRWGCCPLEHAVLCGDSRHCCPKGYSCDKTAGVCYK